MKIEDKRLYILTTSVIIGIIIIGLSMNILARIQYENLFEGETARFNEEVSEQPWQSSLGGNIFGNLGASFIIFFLALIEFPPLTIGLCSMFLANWGLKKVFIKSTTKRRKT